MYLNAETQGFVIPALHYAVGESGFLFLGRAEMVLRGGAGRFLPVSMRNRIFVAQPVDPQVSEPGPTAPVRRRAFDVGLLDVSPLEMGVATPPEATEPAESVVAELLVDAEGLLTGSNDSARELFGIEPRDMARPLGELRFAFEPLELESHVRRALVERVSHLVGGTRYQTPDGGTIELEIWVLPLFTEHDTILGAAVTFADVGSTMQLRESFRHVHEELETAYEELQSTNEELVTSNEELQSSYEELETGNEELQSSNEELETTNEELRASNEELETTYLELKSTSEAVERLNETLVEANLELRRFSGLHRQVMDHFPACGGRAQRAAARRGVESRGRRDVGPAGGGRRRGAVLRTGLRPGPRTAPGTGPGVPELRSRALEPRARCEGRVRAQLQVPRTVLPVSGHEPETSAMLVMDAVGDTAP